MATQVKNPREKTHSKATEISRKDREKLSRITKDNDGLQPTRQPFKMTCLFLIVGLLSVRQTHPA